jgi:hypothetical protein
MVERFQEKAKELELVTVINDSVDLVGKGYLIY